MTRIGRSLALWLASIPLFFGGLAQAKTMVAGPLRITNGDELVCDLLNIGKKDLTDVVIEAITEDVESEGPLTIAPGQTDSASNSVGVGASRATWCRFSFKGGGRSVRGSACVRANTTESCGAALEAR